jgi:hypothetical protein
MGKLPVGPIHVNLPMLGAPASIHEARTNATDNVEAVPVLSKPVYQNKPAAQFRQFSSENFSICPNEGKLEAFSLQEKPGFCKAALTFNTSAFESVCRIFVF